MYAVTLIAPPNLAIEIKTVKNSVRLLGAKDYVYLAIDEAEFIIPKIPRIVGLCGQNFKN